MSVVQALRAAVGRENAVPGRRWEACRGEFSCEYGIVTVVSIGHGKDVSSAVLAPVVARRGQRLCEITQTSPAQAVALSVGIRRINQRHALRVDAGTVARPCCVGLRTDTSRPRPDRRRALRSRAGGGRGLRRDLADERLAGSRKQLTAGRYRAHSDWTTVRRHHLDHS